MTTKQIFQFKHECYVRHSSRWARIRKAAYPETGGVGLYIHNWYACSQEDPTANLAGIIADSGEWASWHRIEARIDRWMDAAEHRAHVGKFSPLWCDICKRA